MADGGAEKAWGCRRWVVVGVPLALYLVIGGYVAWQQREGMHEDVIAYVRRGIYWARGDFYHAISSYWSPMISWCIAPLVGLGMDGVYAARLVCFVWGAGLVVSFWMFLDGFVSWGWGWKLAVMVTALPAVVQTMGGPIRPDVIVAAWLFAYFAAAVHPGLMESRRLQVLAGVLGGAAYLAKAYAFPFVLVHWIVTVGMRGWGEGSGFRVRGSGGEGVSGCRGVGVSAWVRVVGVWVWGMVGFGVVAGAWVGVLTWRYGGMTFGSVGKAAHALVGPREDRKVFEVFAVPDGPYIAAWENPERVHHGYWSPVESRKYFLHQLAVIRRQAGLVGGTIWGFDRLHIGAMAMAAGLVWTVVAGVRAAKGTSTGAEGWKTPWLVLTIALYYAGFLPIYFAGAYVIGVVGPLIVVLCVKLAMELPGVRGRWRYGLTGLVIASFLVAGYDRVKELRYKASGVSRNLAQEIQRWGATGAVAGNDRVRSSLVAVHLGQKYVGFPPDEDLEAAEGKLREANVGVMLVWRGETRKRESSGSAKHAPEVARRAGWRHLFAGHNADVYAPPWAKVEEPTTRAATRPARGAGNRAGRGR